MRRACPFRERSLRRCWATRENLSLVSIARRARKVRAQMSVTATPSTVPSEVRHTRTPGRADPSRPTTPIRMLFFVREAFPTFRVDVDILFGNELLGRGHQIDFVMQGARESEPAGPRS